MLALCVGVQLLEASGRWDDTVQDANDEAGIVAIVLCIGVAIATATALTRLFASTCHARHTMASASIAVQIVRVPFNRPVLSLGPPVPLRV